ncbi:hypothetical protein ACFLZP_02385 [Patescibacteria group bacterium]
MKMKLRGELFLKWGLILLTIGWVGVYLVKNRDSFEQGYNSTYWQHRYLKSQWVQGYQSSLPMGDGELYAYAGWRQILGDDPTLVNPEHPPLGKYLLGLSIKIFANPRSIAPILGFFLLFLLYKVSKHFLKKSWLAWLVVFFFSSQSLFREELIASMLDLPLALLVMLSFYFFLKSEKKVFYFLPALFSLGLVAATKMYLLGFGLIGLLCVVMLGVAVWQHEKKYLFFFLFLPFALLAYLSSYFVYFAKGHGWLDFKYLLFWIRHFARVRVEGYPRGEILRILMLGRWRTWWDSGAVISVRQWSFIWPLGAIASGLILAEGLREKNFALLFLGIWPFIFLSVFFWGVPYPRYLLPILPFFYLNFVYQLKAWGERSKWGLKKR